MRRIQLRRDRLPHELPVLDALGAPELATTLRERALALRDRRGHARGDAAGRVPAHGDLCAFIRDAGVDVVFSVSPGVGVAEDLRRRGPRARALRAGAHRLPRRPHGGADRRDRGRARERPHDLFYRAGAERPYLGRHGMLKTEIAGPARPRRGARGLTADISVSPGDTLFGDDWFRAPGRLALDARRGGRSQHPRPRRRRSGRDRAVRGRAPGRRLRRGRGGVLPGPRRRARRCSRSRRGTWRRARRAPARSSSRAATAGCSSPGRHYLARASPTSRTSATCSSRRGTSRRGSR